uniref:Frizzled receptor 3 n=1 Tax=Clytia hemisphaerica TaxID=252671 RepID=A4UAH3_9CNID|nr:frizzled receptor 3 [Clytia hemisphaerica]
MLPNVIKLTFALTLFLVGTGGARQRERCVPLINDHCKDLGYNATLIPNVKAGIDKLDEAARRISEFSPLFQVNCYENFKFFICNMFLPVCHSINGNPTPVYPCRHVCEEARKGCEPLMKKYSFTWPDVLNCEFLASNTKQNALCGSPPPSKPTRKTPQTEVVPTAPPAWVKVVEQFPKGIDVKVLQSKENLALISTLFKTDRVTFKSVCKLLPNSIYLKKTESETCVSKCEATSPFTKENKKFASVWVSTWSIICFLSTLVTVTTFLVDHKRFKYPERPIIFLSFCYNLYSIGYLIRVFGNYENIVCENSPQGQHALIDGMSSTSCAIVFFLLYFFGMASALWWVVLSVTWFLAAALKWGHEAIEKYSSLFHAVAWTVPTIQTIIALVTRKVDTDMLAGVCYIGATNSENLLMFVALPLLIYLLIGTLFLIMGFVALIKIRKELQRERNTNKLERLIIRIGIFSVLYSVPASIVVGCFIHEYNRLKRTEQVSQDMLSCLKDPNCEKDLKPRTEIFYLRYFMLLVVGVTSGVWIWTSKTFDSWKNFYRRRFPEKSSKQEEEKERLYKNSFAPTTSNLQSAHAPPRRRSSNEALNQYTPASTVASHPAIAIQPGMYAQPATNFFFPIQQHPAVMQAHNLPVSQAKIVDSSSRGFTVTPSSNMTSDYEHNEVFNNYNNKLIQNGHDMMHRQANYAPSSSSEHYTASLPRNGRPLDPPASPKSMSSRSHYSNEAKM